jgi:hypothetical protein
MKFVLFYAICLHYLLAGTKIQDVQSSNQFCLVVVVLLVLGIVANVISYMDSQTKDME